MDIEGIQPIPHEPAFVLRKKHLFVIADLHIGIESELRELGLHITSQTKDMTQHLLSLLTKYNPKDIILLGDIKHMIPTSTNQERKDVMRFLDIIQSYGTIHLVPGNHDGNIIKLVSNDIVVHPSSGFVFEGIGFVHGHRWPTDEIMNCSQIVIGHTHPTIMLTDRLGHQTFEPCWLRGNFIKEKLKTKYPDAHNPEIIVMPAFNPLCGGAAANKDGLTGPVFKLMDIDNAQVYLLDGTLLGRVHDI